MNATQRHGQAPPGFDDVRLVGTGATSRVYRGVNADGHVRALKRLNRHLVRSQDALARLRRELELLRTLRHSGIVAVYDVISWAGDPTLVMDFVEGEDLEAVVARSGGLPAAEVERIGRALLDILATTHAAGIVHRDLKPQNVRLGTDGQVYLLDFGSARLDAASQLTATGTTVGTPDYMAPELFAGSAYDPRVDIYGVGATLYEALTGAPPQSADSLAALTFLRQTTDVQPVSLRAHQTPANLAQVVDRCLARDPGDRYASAAQALWALDHDEAERAFALHRSRYPPCLHCDAPVPPTRVTCPSCGDDHAFSFPPGSFHVEVTGLADTEGLVRWLTGRFPELANEPERLFEWFASVGAGGRRYVNFVSRPAAKAEVRRLTALGVSANVVREGHYPGIYIAIAGLAVLALMILTPAIVIQGIVASVIVSYFGVKLWRRLTARNSLLGAPSLGSPVRGTLAAVTTWLMAAWMIPKPWLPTMPQWEWLQFDPGEPLAWASAGLGLCGAAAVGVWGRFRGSELTRSQAPQPVTISGAAKREGAEKRTARGWRSFAMALITFLVIGLEFMVVDAMVGPLLKGGEPTLRGPTEIAQQLGRGLGSSVETATALKPGQRWPSAGFRAEQDAIARARAEPRGHSAGLGSVTDSGDTPQPPPPLWPLMNLLPAALAAEAVRRTLLQRRRIRREADALAAEVGPLWGPIAPTTRHGDPDSDLYRLRGGDSFTDAAAARASALEGLVDDKEMVRVEIELRRLRGRVDAERDASLLARCVLETDDEQKARFQFLALEGQLETQAAEAWWRSQE